MKDDEERAFLRDVVAAMREPPPAWVKRGDQRGTENIGRDDVSWPDARGVEPEAKIVRRELDRMFRVRRDGDPVPVEESAFRTVCDAVKIRAFPTRRQPTRRERIAAVQLLAQERLGLHVSAEDVGHRLDRGDTPPTLARWLLALKRGVSPRRLRIPRKL